MKILKIRVLLTEFMDNVVVYTDLPCQMPVEVLSTQDPLALTFYAPKDGGVEYVRNVFDIEPEIVDLRFNPV